MSTPPQKNKRRFVYNRDFPSVLDYNRIMANAGYVDKAVLVQWEKHTINPSKRNKVKNMSDNINMKNLPTNSEPGVPKNIPPELVPVYDWWIKDGKSTLVMVAIAAVVVGAFYGVKGWMKQRNANANAAVSQAYLAQSSASDLETAVAQYGSSKAGVPLKLRLAKEYYDTASYDKALEIYDAIIEL
jgi:hypothetical protein